MDKIQEKHLISLFNEGSNEALGLLFKEHYRELVMYAYRYIPDSSTSEDIVASIFSKLLHFSTSERKERLGNVDNLKHYLFIAVRHKAFDIIKQTKNRNSIVDSIKGLFINYSHQSEFIAEDTAEKLFQYLTKREKQIMSLHMAGFDNAEIAEKLGITKITVANILFNSKKKLRVLFNSMISLLLFLIAY